METPNDTPDYGSTPENLNVSAVTGGDGDMNDSLLIPGQDEAGDPSLDFGEPTKRDDLGTKEVAAYSVGHVNNDLCACMWFVYLTWYLTNVVGLDPSIVGLCLLSGQITDGITTPIVGYLSDKVNCPGGRRNFWYYFGFSFVNLCFLGIFTNPPFLKTETARNIWYLVMPALFNIGWASVQIAHLAIVNSLTYGQRRRDKLINYRNGFTYIANVMVLSFATLAFLFISS